MNNKLKVRYFDIRGHFKIMTILIACGLFCPAAFFYMSWFIVDIEQIELMGKIIFSFFRFITPLFGLVFFCILNLTLFGSFVINVDDSNVTINKYIFKYLFNSKTIPLDDIKNMSSNVNMSTQVRFEARSYKKGKEIQVASYTIKFLLQNGKFVELPQIYDLEPAQEIMKFLDSNLEHHKKNKLFSHMVENIV